jgi:hypothetical protein
MTPDANAADAAFADAKAEMAKGRVVFLFADPGDADCEPVRILQTLLAADALPGFERLWRRKGNCHEITQGLLIRLYELGFSPERWVWVHGQCGRAQYDGKPLGLHSWIEVDGWAIDAANGGMRPALVARADHYREEMQATDIACRLDFFEMVAASLRQR